MKANQSKKRFVKASVSAALVASSISSIVVPTSAATFSDLSPANSHYENIINLLERGIVSGFPDGTYRPNVAVTRGQAAKILANILNLDLTNLPNPNFVDVNEDHQYYPYIAALVNAGIISGYSDQTFKPGNTITRGQMAKMIALGFNLQANTEANFSDVPQNHQYASYVNALFAANVTIGTTATTFDLAGSVTRGQLASFVVRAENAMQSNDLKISGTISEISKNSITVNSKKYNVGSQVAFLTAASNTEALMNADVTFTVKNNHIEAISSLHLKNGASFDAQNATIDALSIAPSFTALKNVTATTITLSVGAKTTIDNVTATTFTAQSTAAPVAALASTVPAIDLIFNGSTVDVLNLLGAIAAVQKTASTITTLHAEDVTKLALNGDFKNVYVSPATAVLGNAIIDFVYFSENLQAVGNIDSSIQIRNAVINGETQSWSSFVNQLTSNTSSNTGSSSNNSSSNGDEWSAPPISNGSNTGGNTTNNDANVESNPPTNNDTNTDGNSPSDTDTNTGGNSPSDNGENTVGNSPADNGTNTGEIITPNPDPALPTMLLKENIRISANFDTISGITATQDSGSIIYIYNDLQQLIGEGFVLVDGKFEVALTSADSSKITVREDEQLTIVVEKDVQTPGTNPATQAKLTWTVPVSTNSNNGDNETGTTPIPNPKPETETPLPPTTGSIKVEGNTVQVGNGDEVIAYEVKNEDILAFLTANISILTDVQMEVENNEVTAIQAAKIMNAEHFNGDSLQNIAIDTLTLQNAAEVQNIQAVNNLIVENASGTLTFDNVSANIVAKGNVEKISGAAGDNLVIESTAANIVVENTASKNIEFENVSANITVKGSFEKISGAAGEQLIIESTVANVTVENTTSNNIIIKDSSNVAQLKNKRIASTSANFAATETKMAITFASGNYSGKTLNINRKDTVVNVSGNPFSEIQINSDNIDLYTFGQEINRLTISNKVSYLALDANVSEFKVTLGQPLTIHSSSTTKPKIDSLVITATDTTNKIDLINVQVLGASFNGSSITGTITDHPIFKKNAAITDTISEFSSALERVSFGKYKINIADAGTYYMLELKDSSLVDKFTKISSLAAINTEAAKVGVANTKSYTVGTSFVYYADVTDVIVYKVNGDTIEGVSVAAAPSNTALTRLYDISETGALTYHTRFSSSQSPSTALGTVYVFKNGSLAKEVPVTGSWVDLGGLNTIVVNTGLEFTTQREVVLANNSLSSYYTDTTTYPDDFVNILKVISKKAVEKNNPKLIERLLNYVFSQQEGTYDSNFLSEFVNKVNANPANYNSIDNLKELSKDIINKNPHNSDVKLKASDLYLTGKISSTFTYSTDHVITNTVNDSNEILFNALKEGSTTLRVTDSNGLATLVNVTVDANKKIITKVLATDAPAGTFIEGASNFRYSNGQLIATTLAKSAAIIKTGTDIQRVTLTPDGTAFTLSNAETLTTETVAPTAFGLNNITSISGDNVGFYKENGQFILFARYAGNEIALVTDGTNTTALNTKTDTAIKDFATSTSFEKAITKSNSLAINNDLNLLSVNSEVFAPSNTKNVFLYNDGANITAFANDSFTGSIKLTDSANTISIVNVIASKGVNAVTINPIEVIKTSLADDTANTGASVQHIDKPVVRANGLDLYAIGTGTAIVTLTNGKQYSVNVNSNSGVYSITKEEIQNLIVKANDLHMKDIVSVAGADSVQLVNSNSEAIISLPNTTGKVLTLLSSNNEKTFINVTRDGNSYSYTPYRSSVESSDVGLNDMTAVYNAGTAPTPPAARAKVAAVKEVVNGVEATKNKLFIYGLEADDQAFRVSDGTQSTLINVEVTVDGNGFKSKPTAVTHQVNGYTIDTAKDIVGAGARLVGNMLYATGESFNGSNTATVKVPLVGGSYYIININYNADTGLYNFDENGTVTFTESFTKEQLGLTTVTNAQTDAADMTATTANDIVTVAITKDTEGRIEVTGTDAQGKQAKTFIYIKRDANGVTKNIERAEDSTNAALDLDLTSYGYTSTPTGSWSVDGIGRATISSALKLNIYAQDAGQSLYTLTDGNGKDLLIHIVVSATNPRETTAKVIEEAVSTDAALTGSIISTDGIRLSADGKKVYATKENGKATLKLTNADNTVTKYFAYAVEKNADGSYKITPTELANASVTLNGAKLLPEEPANVVQQQGNEFVAIGVGTVHVLHVDNGVSVIKAITVTKDGEHFKIEEPAIVSNAVINATDLGLSAASALTIETTADPNFYVGQLDGKIVAYSKLSGSTTGSYEFVVKAQDTGNRAVVRLTDAGTDALTHKVAKADNITFNNASSVTIKDLSIARFDKATDTLYLLKEDSTYATADNGRLFAIDVIRDNNQLALLPLEDGTTIDVKPLQITDATKVFSKIAETKESIIEIDQTDGKTIYAKALGTTKVKLGDNILTVTIAKNADGQYRMTQEITSSKLVTLDQAGLTNFKSAEVKAGNADAIALSLGKIADDKDELTIFSNGAKTAQSLLVHVVDKDGNKAAINVTVDATGAVTAADVVKHTIDVDVTGDQTVQTAGARGVWKDKKLTVYTLAATNAALQFTNALVNVTTTADGNKLNEPTITPLTHGIASIETTTTNAVKKDNPYLLALSSGLVYAGNKVYSVDVKEENNQFVKAISTGVPAVTFDLTNITGTYAEDQSTLTAAKVIGYPDEAKKLIVYANGTGTSELAITDGTNTTIYQTKATASSIAEPKAAKLVFTDASMNNATVIAGDALRINNDTMYFLKEGNIVLKATDDKLINATVTRDADGYFTATPVFVTKQLKEKATLAADSKFIAETETKTNPDTNPVTITETYHLFVKEAGTETFYTDNYRVTATATEANNAYNLTVDERHMAKFNVADYFSSGTVTAKASPSTHAFGEVVDGKLIIYAGTTAGESTVTFTNSTNDVTFNVTHDATGKVTATPQTNVKTVKFTDLGLADATIAENSYNNAIVELVKTADGISIYPKETGLTSFALTDGTNTVRLVNVKIEKIAGAFEVTPTPIIFKAVGGSMVSTLTTEAAATAGDYYATSTGTALYGTVNTTDLTAKPATFVTVSQNGEKGAYHVQTSDHVLSTVTAESLGLDSFEHVSLVGSSVETKLNSDKDELYIYGTNNGYTDVLVNDGTNYATIVTSHQNKSLQVTLAKKAIDKLADASWTTALVAIRDGVMYASHTGKAVAEATMTKADTSEYKALMNITVTRKSNQQFDIVDDVIRKDVGTATVISGTSVVADGNYIYAQQVGSSVIKVGNEFKTVTVTQSADGLYGMEVGAGFTSNIITATEVGLSEIKNYKLSAITGADVVEVQLINGEAHLFAKKAGEVHLVLSVGTDSTKVQTSVHVLVEEQSGKLTLTPTPSKLDLGDKELQFKTTNELFRTVGKSIYAIKDGSIFATIGNELHKLTVSNNTLYTTKTRIEAELPGNVTINPSDAILTADSTNPKLVVAKDFGTTNVKVGSDEYQVTVKEDGSVEYKKLSKDAINVKDIFTATNVTTVTIGLDSIIPTEDAPNNNHIVTATIDNTTKQISLTPVKKGTETVLISDGTNTIQAIATVDADENNDLFVTHVVPVSKYYTSAIGYYPTVIKQPNGTDFTSANGLITLKDGEITVYPGAIGTAQMIIEGEDNRKGLFELTVTADDYQFGHFVQTIGYDKFASNPTVLATKGKAKATPGITGLDVIFEDLNQSFFVVKTTGGYKVVEVQAEVSGDSFVAKAPVIYNALTITGEVTNVKGLHTVEDGGKTIIYADATTTFPASYTLDGVIYEVTAGTAPAQLTATALTKDASPLTEATHLQGDNVVALIGGNWTAKAAGKGIYRVMEGTTLKYVEMEVAISGNSYEIKNPKELKQFKFDNSLSSIQIVAPSEKVYTDSENNTIYGETAETVIITGIIADKKVVYSGKFATDSVPAQYTVAKAELLDTLEWTEFKEHSLNAASTIMRIEGNNVYALAPGEEYITFKSPNGLERKLKVVVNADYTISITAETSNVLTYSASASDQIEEIHFTFNLNVPENVSGLTINMKNSTADAYVNANRQLKVIVQAGTEAVSTFEIVLPELKDSTPLIIKVNTTNITKYEISNEANAKLKFNLVQP